MFTVWNFWEESSQRKIQYVKEKTATNLIGDMQVAELFSITNKRILLIAAFFMSIFKIVIVCWRPIIWDFVGCTKWTWEGKQNYYMKIGVLFTWSCPLLYALCRQMRCLVSLCRLSTVQQRPHPSWESMVFYPKSINKITLPKY